MAEMIYKPKDEQRLMTELWDPYLVDDLEKFVMFMFPWGKENTPLWQYKQGPRTWQRDELQAITAHIKEQKQRMDLGLNPRIYRSSTASGRGIGKSALVSWINLWMMTTRIGSSSITTANTEEQLTKFTWAELGKWHTLAMNAHWFDRSALSLKPSKWFEDAIKKPPLQIDSGYYYAVAKLWSEDNPDSFAGAHNTRGQVVIFDEASGIHEVIWNVTQGFFTDPVLDRYWFAFSNPRRNTGAFFECFNKNRDQWKNRHIDSRNVEGTDKDYLDEIVKKYGEDSDVSNVEVKGKFPDQGDDQFISRETIEGAAIRDLQLDSDAAIVMGVDVARFGKDSSVIRFRQGRDARSIPPIRATKLDNMQLAELCIEWINKVNPDAVCIDAGNGTGVIDRLNSLGYKVHEIWFGERPDNVEWADRRTELWGEMREWLRGGMIDSDMDLQRDLCAPRYKFSGKGGDRIKLESKEDMRKNGFPSPDDGDALALTFAVKPAHRGVRAAKMRVKMKEKGRVVYNPLNW